MKITLNKSILIDDLNLPENAIHDEITDTSRWSVNHEVVFKYNDRFYMTWYSEGATEMQDESPWEYEDEVECVEVELKKVEVVKWITKD